MKRLSEKSESERARETEREGDFFHELMTTILRKSWDFAWILRYYLGLLHLLDTVVFDGPAGSSWYLGLGWVGLVYIHAYT